MLTEKEVARLLDAANAGVNRGEITLARRVYDGILATHPNHTGAQLGKALSFIAVAQYPQADALLKTVLERLPDDPDALVYLGLSAVLSDRKDEARDYLEKVPENAPGAYSLARSLLETL